MEKRTLPIRGMHCASCSGRIERVVGGMDGVSRVAVNLATETMDVSYDPALLTPEDMAERIAGLGFEAVLPKDAGTVRLALGGMHCASCARRIENAVGAMEGVGGVRVNLATETGEVDLPPGGPSIQEVIDRIAQLGFTASALEGDDESLYQAQEREAASRLEARRKALIPELVLAGLVLALAMGPMLGMGLPAFLSPDASPGAYALAQLALTAPIIWLGRRFYLDGVPALLRGVPTMDTLIALGTGAAFAASLWSTAEILLGHEPGHGVHGLYYESAAVIIALISLGKYFEALSKARTGEAVRALVSLAPDTARRLEDGRERTVPVREVRPGDLLRVLPGERVPVDGAVVEGASEVDESMLTGESVPVAKNPGDPLSSGTMNALGALTMRAERVGPDTVLARIVRLVRQAQGSKAPIANLADRVSLYFVPAVMVLAVLSGLAWLAAGEGWQFALRVTVSVLVIACPCAMGLATPTSIMVGTGRGARLGVLIKSGEALEKASAVRTVALDKTGTLTLGRPELAGTVLAGGGSGTGRAGAEPASAGPDGEAPGAMPLPLDARGLLALAASVEALSAHPLGQALVRAAGREGLELVPATDALAVPGQGVAATVAGRRVLVGRPQWLAEQGTAVPGELLAEGERQSALGRTPLFVGVERGEALGLLSVADAIRPEAAEVVARLSSMGIGVAMLTGDSPETARAIAAQAGVAEVFAQVTPEGKAERVRQLRARGGAVAMVGDGINDAPALAAADVGISMGTGIDVAIEAGDVVLMRGDLRALATALGLARATVRNIRQNLFWAFAYNVLGIPVAAGVLYAFGGPTLSPMIAGAAMAMSSVSVVTNALRLRFFRG